MEHIPDDATHWDGGDWIEYHRTSLGLDERPGTAATRDPLARMTAMHVSMLRAAKSYYEITGHHLPIYRMIAHVHAAIFYDLPLEGPERCCAGTGIEILHLPPHGPDYIVQVDLSQPFHTLIVVRILDNFTTQARMIPRNALRCGRESGRYGLRWQAMPRAD